MGFLKKLKFWKKKRNVSSGENNTSDAATQTDVGIQDLCMDLKQTSDVGIQVVSGDNLTCEGSSQTGSWWDGDLMWQLHECRGTVAAYEQLLRKKRRQKRKLQEELKRYKRSATSSVQEQKKTEVSSISPMCDDEEEERRTAIVLAKMKEICQRYRK